MDWSLFCTLGVLDIKIQMMDIPKKGYQISVKKEHNKRTKRLKSYLEEKTFTIVKEENRILIKRRTITILI